MRAGAEARALRVVGRQLRRRCARRQVRDLPAAARRADQGDRSQHLACPEVEAAAGPTVRGDRDQLFEAVANLLDNAVKFTPEGG